MTRAPTPKLHIMSRVAHRWLGLPTADRRPSRDSMRPGSPVELAIHPSPTAQQHPREDNTYYRLDRQARRAQHKHVVRVESWPGMGNMHGKLSTTLVRSQSGPGQNERSRKDSRWLMRASLACTLTSTNEHTFDLHDMSLPSTKNHTAAFQERA
ncbi:hypothetical protein LZ31DRAFT_140500 [Colletotrichum somersetense]|nr:hypothetical protein LZ31DRAFT_140500 [Colletotrichum somersetense]